MRLLNACLSLVGAAAILIVILVGVIIVVPRACPGGDGWRARQAAAAEQELAYLRTEIPEVKWVRFDGNECIVAFDPIPNDLHLIVTTAALNGNRAIGFGYHVWAVSARLADREWEPGEPGLVAAATARHGKITDYLGP